MPGRQKYRHDDRTVDAAAHLLGSVATAVVRYVLVYVDSDNNLHPMIERKSNNQESFLMYKSMAVATDKVYQIGSAQPEEYTDSVAVFDRQSETVL